MPLEKTQYQGIYKRTQRTSRVSYLARARVKGAVHRVQELLAPHRCPEVA